MDCVAVGSAFPLWEPVSASWSDVVARCAWTSCALVVRLRGSRECHGFVINESRLFYPFDAGSCSSCFVLEVELLSFAMVGVGRVCIFLYCICQQPCLLQLCSVS